VVHFKSPRKVGLEIILHGKRGGGWLSKETETRDPKLGRRGGGAVGLEASEGLSGAPGGLKYGLEEKWSPKYLTGYRFQSDLTLNHCLYIDIWFHTLMHNLELIWDLELHNCCTGVVR
jgi:hypothetical protein